MEWPMKWIFVAPLSRHFWMAVGRTVLERVGMVFWVEG